MSEKTENSTGWLRPVILVALAICAFVALVVGALAFALGVDEWIDGGFSFSGWGMLVWVIGLVGAGIMMAGMIVIGIILRFLTWRRAPRASLGLAVISTGFIVVTHSIFTSLDGTLASLEYFLVQAMAVAALIVTPLPPFLHWLRSDRPADVPAKPLGDQS